MSFPFHGIPSYDAEELLQLYKQKGSSISLIDVREPDEYEAGHIPGARLFPMSQMHHWLEQLDPKKEYVLICRSGNRSYQVARYLRGLGFDKVYNFAGGMLSWKGPVEKGNRSAH